MRMERVRTRSEVNDGATVLTVHGILESVSYRQLRDVIIEAAIDAPRAVIVDMTELVVPTESALAVFTSARWHIARWPDIPLLLVCCTPDGRNLLRRNGISRFLPVYPAVQQAAAAVAAHETPERRRARIVLTPDSHGVHLSRQLVSECMQDWARPEVIPAAKVVVSALVENAALHAGGATAVRLEMRDDVLTVAVEDSSTIAPAILERFPCTEKLSSLKIIDAICRTWGCSPTTTGKVVWCAIGPENTL
ncbi:STAS domain-containing protein [Mycolicibacterium pallens]|uniref:STAS domain-containing protein n=1 Tax=Mycolicibacterium pallens TaxID=370524 RepID=A0ABX8VE52_9MYCO|nr:STAS domain-containing protein [Mycolicibacterium pallens]QYL16049.1 STAS domain-containing protein [Mycolicibacterium pallens]